jgi:LacI family transcriptional regulator, galactose operon repressor
MRAFRKLIEKGLRPTAVMCSNDISAIGVMREAFERGVKVPEEQSVIGFDDVPIARFTIPPLTSVRISGAKIGRWAFEALMEGLQRERRSAANIEYVVNTELVLRGSTALVCRQQNEVRGTGSRRDRGLSNPTVLRT